MMTSLQVICDLGPPIKNPGCAYKFLRIAFGLNRLKIEPESTVSVANALYALNH